MIWSKFFPSEYIVDVEFTKYPKNDKIRSRQHKGPKVNNQFAQVYMKIYNKESLLDELSGHIRETYPGCQNARNFRIIKLMKI